MTWVYEISFAFLPNQVFVGTQKELLPLLSERLSAGGYGNLSVHDLKNLVWFAYAKKETDWVDANFGHRLGFLYSQMVCEHRKKPRKENADLVRKRHTLRTSTFLNVGCNSVIDAANESANAPAVST